MGYRFHLLSNLFGKGLMVGGAYVFATFFQIVEEELYGVLGWKVR